MRFADIMRQTEDRLKDETKLRSFSRGSIARGLLESWNEVATDASSQLDLDIINAYISTAVGSKLDEIGVLVGESRKQFTYAVGPIKFIIDSLSGKTLEDLKDIVEEETGSRPTDIIIPSGTEITNEDGTIVYNSTADAVIGDDPVYVDAIASNVGESGRVGSGALEKITSFPSELTSILTYIIVTNTQPIESGENEESDENYRYRIANSYTSNAKANDISIELSALSVPGVADVHIRNYEYGIGSTGIFIISESPIVSQGILNTVQQAVNGVKSSGENVVVSAPTYKGFKISTVLQFKPDTSLGDRDIVVDQVRANQINYINNLQMGEEIVINQLRDVVSDTSETIYDFQLISLGIGEYNFETGLIDYFEPSLPVNQPIGQTEKFVTNSKLCDVCC